MAECKDCHRYEATSMMDDPDERCMGGTRCQAFARHYQRGLAAGVELAKKTAKMTSDYYPKLDFSATDDALRRGGGE